MAIFQTRPSYQLTPYAIGSLKEIFTLSLPLILGILSTNLMLFSDRLLLARYSLDAMTAASVASYGAYAVFTLPMDLAGVTDLFTGQLHGFNASKVSGKIVWQMIWFACLLCPVFLLLGHVLPNIFFSKTDLEVPCFKILVSFGSFFCLAQALIGYFAAQGRVRLVFIATLLGNLVNIFLDLLLIFGIGPIPALGATGAALATVFGQVFIFFFLLIFFLLPKERKEGGTNLWKIDVKIFYQCIKVGFPAALGHTQEFVSYFLFYLMMKHAGGYFLLITTLAQSAYYLMSFLIEGLVKASSSLFSNLLGAKMHALIKGNLFSTIKLHAIFIMFLTVFYAFFPKILFPFFFSSTEDLALLQDPQFVLHFLRALKFVVLYFLFDGLAWIFLSLLMASGDTKYIMKVGIIVPWFSYLIPTFFGVTYFHLPIEGILAFGSTYDISLFICYLVRYVKGGWKKHRVAEEITSHPRVRIFFERPSEYDENTQNVPPLAVYSPALGRTHNRDE